MPRFAALDLGSNALRLRIVEADGPSPGREQLSLLTETPSTFREVTSLRAPVRLGSEVFVTGRLAAASIGQACAALRDFRQAMDLAKVDAYRATATIRFFCDFVIGRPGARRTSRRVPVFHAAAAG